jgi:DNA-binding transcriptional ArsR family regulator
MRDETAQTTKDVTKALLQAYSHPVRYRIVRTLVERDSASGKEIAAAVGKPRSTVGDQLRELQAAGVIECVAEESRRGTIERFYRLAPAAHWVHDEEMSQAGAAEKRMIGLRVLQSAAADASAALAANTLDRRDEWCMSSMRLTVDVEGWKELAEIHRQALAEVARVLDASDERRAAGTSGESLLALCAFMLVELPELRE